MSRTKMERFKIMIVQIRAGLSIPDSDARALLYLSLLSVCRRRSIQAKRKGMAMNRSLTMVIRCPLALSLYEKNVRNVM